MLDAGKDFVHARLARMFQQSEGADGRNLTNCMQSLWIQLSSDAVLGMAIRHLAPSKEIAEALYNRSDLTKPPATTPTDAASIILAFAEEAEPFGRGVDPTSFGGKYGDTKPPGHLSNFKLHILSNLRNYLDQYVDDVSEASLGLVRFAKRCEYFERSIADASDSESLLQDRLAAYLFDLGLDITTEESTQQGRMDFLVRHGSLKDLIEVKVFRNADMISKIYDGITQTLGYMMQLSLQRGYLLIFDLTKNGLSSGFPSTSTDGVTRLTYGNMEIYIAIAQLKMPLPSQHKPKPKLLREEDWLRIAPPSQ